MATRGKTYPLELRMRVIQAHERDGEGYKKLSKRFDIPLNSVVKMVRTYKEKKAKVECVLELLKKF